MARGYHTCKEGITFLQQIISIDEAWVHNSKPELKSSSEIWKGKNLPRLQKFRRQASTVKQIMIKAYNYTNVTATYTVPCCTVEQHV